MRTGVLLLLAVSVSMPVYSQTATFASDCVTPKTTFNLGETVCAKASGLIGLRFQWVDPDGFAVSTSDITADPQTSTFTLPSTNQSAIGAFFTANNLGRWRVNAITPRNSSKTAAFFTVKNPSNPKVDLSIVKSIIGSEDPAAGGPVQFNVTIENAGPDDAANAHFVDNTYSNATFDSLSQTSGPAFTCTGADCQIASLPNGAVATFTLNFTAGTSGTVVENTATVSSNTAELNSTDNSSSSTPSEIGAGTNPPPPTCNPQVTAPPPVTLYTGASATACSVTIADLDTTLGTGTGSDTCPIVGGVIRSGVPEGNVFPVGITTVYYSVTDDQDTAAVAPQLVTVIDNTPPAITCLSSFTVEPTCPLGAVAGWTEPVGRDNCESTTTQTAGLASGSVFPIGTTQVSYTVTDASGNHASCSFTVTVLTVAATIQNLEASINASALNGTQKNGLLPKLDAVLDAFNRGQTNAACNVLDTFAKSVQNHVAHGDVSAAQGQAWINSAVHVGNTMGCTKNPCS